MVDDPRHDGSACSGVTPSGALCNHASDCGLRPVWNGLGEVIGNFLEGFTVDDVVRSATRRAMMG